MCLLRYSRIYFWCQLCKLSCRSNLIWIILVPLPPAKSVAVKSVHFSVVTSAREVIGVSVNNIQTTKTKPSNFFLFPIIRPFPLMILVRFKPTKSRFTILFYQFHFPLDMPVLTEKVPVLLYLIYNSGIGNNSSGVPKWAPRGFIYFVHWSFVSSMYIFSSSPMP